MGMIGNLLRVTNEELEDYLKDSSKLEERVYNDDEEDEDLVDIDKSWEGIIFLLTGENIQNATDELVQILFSGQLIDEEQDLGYGPAHYLTPEQVAYFNTKISQISSEDLKERYDPERMTELEVYPTIWDDGDEAFEYLDDNFKIIKVTFSEAAANGEALITFIN